MTRLHIPVHLRWGDQDPLGHVNNATVVRILEEARIRAFFTTPDAGADAPPTAVLASGELSGDTGTAMLVANHTITYLKPIPYLQQPLDVQLWVPRVGGSSMEVHYEVCSSRDGGEQEVFVRSSTVLVLIDAATGRPTRWTDAMREVVAAYDEPGIDFSRR